MYLSAALRRAGYSVRHIDHTFLERRDVLAEIERFPRKVPAAKERGQDQDVPVDPQLPKAS